MGTIGAGGCYVASNPAYSTHELQHVLSLSKTNFVIVQSDLLPRILPACDKLGISNSKIFLLENTLAESSNLPSLLTSGGFRPWIDILSHGEGTWTPFEDEAVAKGTTAMLLWTSGTTGVPKAAVCSHFALVAESIMTHDSRTPYKVRSAMNLPSTISVDCY